VKLRRCSILILFIAVAACQPSNLTPTSVATSTLIPTLAPATETPLPPVAATNTPTVPASVVELNGAEVQTGFSLIKFADLYRPTDFAFDTQGQLYVSSFDGHIYVLNDANHDGRADSQTVFAGGYYMPLGVAVQKSTGNVYVSHQGGISLLQDTDHDGVADIRKVLVDNLPTDEHQNDNLKFAPDGWLYMGLGSTCDACAQTNPKSATILGLNVDTNELQIYATGLRNPYDLAFDPITGDLFATDNGRDDLGMDEPHEELNHIVQGGNYGFPNCWDQQNQPACENTIPAVAFFEAHSSADGIDFYNGDHFPAEYRGNAFVTIFGSWLKPNVQTGIQRVMLTKTSDTYASSTSWFVRFPTGVMPLPIAFGPYDALYVGDYINNVIYRISYGVP
jgi:glucose/arabinose dehydrogenase